MNLTKYLKLLTLIVYLPLYSCAGSDTESAPLTPIQEYASSEADKARLILKGSPNSIISRHRAIQICNACLDSLDRMDAAQAEDLDKEKGELHRIMSDAYLDISPFQEDINKRNQAITILLTVMAIMVVFSLWLLIDKKRKEEEEEMALSEEAEVYERKKPISFGKQAEIYDKIIKVMEDEKAYQDPKLSREKLAALVSTNRTYVAKAVEEMSGLTFSDWLANFRNDIIIKELNMNPDISTTDLCIAAGFSTPDYLRRQFKNLNGISFSEFKSNTKALMHTGSVRNSDHPLP